MHAVTDWPDLPPQWGDLPDAGGREPPHSAEAEQSVLGSLLVDNACLPLIGGDLEPAHFFDAANRAVFVALTDLIKSQAPADVVTVFELLQRRGQASDCGGLPYLNALAQAVPSAANVARYAAVVLDRWADRELIAAGDDIARIAWQTGAPMADRMDRIAAVLSGVRQRRAAGGSRVPLLGLDALRKSAQGVRWLIKRVVPANAIGMVYGASGTFKSFLVLDAALHVAHGLPWMGRTTRQGPVIYIAAEGGAGLWSRVDAWHRRRSLQWRTAPFWVVPTAVDLTADAWRVVDAAQAMGVTPSLVVVDTLSQTYAGDENSADEMAAYLREIGARFRELWGCSVMLVHHSGHSATERPRGSSAIRANLDYLMSVFRDEKEMLATMGCVKQKDGEPFGEAKFHLQQVQLGHDEDGDAITSLVARHLSGEDEVQEALAAERVAGRGGRTQMLLELIRDGSTEKELREAFYEAVGITDGEARRKAWQRARAEAMRLGLLDVTAMGIVIDLGRRT